MMSDQALLEFSQPAALRDISAQAYTAPLLILHESLGVTRQYRPELNDTLLLGGAVIFEAESTRVQSPDYHAIRIQFHGGVNRWMIETERFSPSRIYPRDAHYGLLHELMREFEEKTGLLLPSVRIAQLGQGISTITSQGVTWDAKNPWAFETGASYTLQRGKETRTYCARHNAQGNIEFFNEECPQEGFDPTLILDCKALASLKKDGLPVFDWKTFSSIEKDEGTPSRSGGMRR